MRKCSHVKTCSFLKIKREDINDRYNHDKQLLESTTFKLNEVTSIWKEKSNNPNKKLEVLLVGSFLKNWESYEVMEKKNENGLYEYEMYLKRKEEDFLNQLNLVGQCLLLHSLI